ncbi:MAG: ATP-dependent 6-phosphofructokinase [Clostridiales bacterium]|nr:ATP-dependent 6-phosphofructokinase [Clostridiales bacterium]
MMRKIGVLTSGGDAPGMNAAVMSVAKSAARYGMPLVGIKQGYNGLLRRSTSIYDDLQELTLDTVLDIADQPGTYLRTARCAEFMDPMYREFAAQTLRDMEIDGLVVIGGDGSFQGAMRLCELGIPCVCIPGTIDNDLAYTEMTLGYETAVQKCTEAIREIRATSRSHNRPHVVECMGRHCGDVAIKAACATGAEIVVVPEVKWSIDEVAARLNKQIAKGNYRATIVIAEGCWDSMEPFDMYGFLTSHGKQCFEGEPMSANRLASILKRKCGMVEVRSTVVGYTQRGALPVAKDSAFAFEAGHLAVKLLHDGISNQVIGTRHGRVFHMGIEDALKEEHSFRHDLYKLVNDIRD